MWNEAARDPDLTEIRSGGNYRARTPGPLFVRRVLASELDKVLTRFAREAGFSPARPIEVEFKPGIFGHHKVGRAADIYGVGGLGMEVWKKKWDEATQNKVISRPPEAPPTVVLERKTNLGWRLYQSLKNYGRWSQPYGYPIQLFGPWTRTEGPWKFISNFLLHAHRDHIHVSK